MPTQTSCRRPETVAGFAQSQPNDALMTFARGERRRAQTGLGAAGFEPDTAVPLTELNRSQRLAGWGGPVIYQGAFRFHP